MMRSSFTERSSFQSIPIWLGLMLVLLAGMVGIIPTAPALAATDKQSMGSFDIISTGLYHTCRVKTDDTLACWGHDGYGQVSGPNGSSDTFVQVSGGGYHTCGLKADGTLACWGHDGYGQVSGPNSSSDTFAQVSGGGYHTCGLKRTVPWSAGGTTLIANPRPPLQE
jgi:alpha-tubulin suppressor-like RCC1 family protein